MTEETSYWKEFPQRLKNFIQENRILFPIMVIGTTVYYLTYYVLRAISFPYPLSVSFSLSLIIVFILTDYSIYLKYEKGGEKY